MNENYSKTVLSPSARRKFCFYLPLATLAVVGAVSTAILALFVITVMSKGNAPASGNPDAYILMIAGPSVLLISILFITISTSISCILTFLISFIPWRRRIAAFLCGLGLHAISVFVALYFIVSPFK
ncbi:hypothetical protein V202x_52860 [Gimesia aquarii]|uniref:Uncharacterized protein n=1 Tax=Gimesia aquarii TaxID=2527964 RepID=A0A517X2Y8_9PLAN|nr:hypothetical protein V202x_52860 [Gimesia aquarii]